MIDSPGSIQPDSSLHARQLLERYPQRPGTNRLDDARVRRHSVPGGSIRSLHLAAAAPEQGLPVLFVPGWGGVMTGFARTLGAVDPRVRVIYAETREKRSSRLARNAPFSMRHFARDIAAVARDAGLTERGFVLAGSSFGGAVVAQALALHLLKPAATILYDPMPRLWVPRWTLTTLAPLLPVGVIAHLRPGLKRLVLAGMREPTQRRRTARFIDDADLWKWRAAALRMRSWTIWKIAPRVESSVYVVNGSSDRFHAGAIYPQIAAALPHGRLFRVPVDESEREDLMGAILSECALSRGSPGMLELFEQPLRSRL
ncbi:MAG: alpha/beta fold hydrolase [Spirochaetota bacterium]